MRTARRQRGGFTLLELLVAMSMVAVLAASFYATLRTAFKAREAAARAIEPVRTVDLAMELLANDLQSAMPPRGLLAGEFVGEDGVDVYGRPADAVTLHAATGPGPQGTVGGDVERIELRCEIDDDTGRKSLIRYVTTNLLATQAQDPRREVICRDIEAFDVRYHNGAEWQNEWDSVVEGDELPLAVEVTIQLPASTPFSGPADDASTGFTLTRVFPIPCSSLRPGVAAGMQIGREGGR